jgi:predicted metalloprotease
MRFNPKARLDTSRVRDVGGSGGGGGGMGGGGMRIPIPGGTKAGGGIGGIIIIILIFVLSNCIGGGGGTGGFQLPNTSLDTTRMAGTDTGRYANCKTGADANSSPDCARVAVENSLVSYWSKALPAQSNAQFHPEAGVETFTGATGTGCGNATSQVGPFYCPNDQVIYLDTTFFQDVLQQQLNGPSGDFVEPYVLAHEYGHHIQNLLGTMSKVKTQQGPNSDSVRLELQADCYAGMWAKNATSTNTADGQPLIVDLTDADIQQAIEAAKSVGDDRIQKETTGKVNQEQWTHGSAAARVKWFQTGYSQGTLQACDTFSPATVE